MYDIGIEKKINALSVALDMIKTESIRLYARDLVKNIPDYFFYIPASTSGKYHNRTQCKTRGLLLHTILCCKTIDYITDLEYIKDKLDITDELHDAMIVAAIFHDCMKCGNPSEEYYTLHEHPLLAKKFILNTNVEHDIDTELKDKIASLVSTHMGQWTENKYSPVKLPNIEDDCQFIIHMADVLSSRKDIDLTSEEIEKIMNLY